MFLSTVLEYYFHFYIINYFFLYFQNVSSRRENLGMIDYVDTSNYMVPYQGSTEQFMRQTAERPYQVKQEIISDSFSSRPLKTEPSDETLMESIRSISKSSPSDQFGSPEINKEQSSTTKIAVTNLTPTGRSMASPQTSPVTPNSLQTQGPTQAPVPFPGYYMYPNTADMNSHHTQIDLSPMHNHIPSHMMQQPPPQNSIQQTVIPMRSPAEETNGEGVLNQNDISKRFVSLNQNFGYYDNNKNRQNGSTETIPNLQQETSYKVKVCLLFMLFNMMFI